MIAFGITLVAVAVVGFVLGWSLCERAQQNVMGASQRISDMALVSAKNSATYEISLRNAATAIEANTAEIAKLAPIVAQCDRSNGAIMHGLVAGGILKARAASDTEKAPPLKGTQR